MLTPEEAKAMKPGMIIQSLLHDEQYKIAEVVPGTKGKSGGEGKPGHVLAVRIGPNPPRTFRPEDLRYWEVVK